MISQNIYDVQFGVSCHWTVGTAFSLKRTAMFILRLLATDSACARIVRSPLLPVIVAEHVPSVVCHVWVSGVHCIARARASSAHPSARARALAACSRTSSLLEADEPT